MDENGVLTSDKVSYNQLLRQMNNKKSCVASANTSMDTLSPMVVSEKDRYFNPNKATEFIMVSQAHLDKD